MIDTIVLVINYPDFQIIDPEKFTPNAKFVLASFKQYQRSVQNYKQIEGEYRPNLTLYKHVRPMGIQRTLYIKFSIPKLMFGNNLDEVSEDDFIKVLHRLQDTLLEMGVKIELEQLSTSLVSKIDYGKNFVLTDYSFPFTYMDEIRRANISKVFDANQADYRNEGHSLSYRTNTFEIIFYDKMKDLAKANISPKKSVDNDKAPQRDFFHTVKLKQRKSPPFEVLRVEIRLNNRKRIRTVLKKINQDIEPTFGNLFSTKVAKLICLLTLNEIKEKIIFTKKDDKPFSDQLLSLARSNPELKPSFLLQYLGFQNIVNEHDLRTAREIVFPAGSSAWYSFKNKSESVVNQKKELLINKIISETERFRPIQVFDI
ncbi:MAG: hypothetical protein OEX81_02780 [Candidatus Pacebacteria bacterium]|nr:hypothetical protein [Candidatus Paceibacterota bacterium]